MGRPILAAAPVLASTGIPAVVFERAFESPADLRPPTWHPRTLDMMVELVAADELTSAASAARHARRRGRRNGAVTV